MTDPTPTEQSTSAPLMAAQPTTVLLRHPATKGTMWTFMLTYVAALAFSVPILALLVLVTMPLGVGPEHPRRALHLWVTGLVAAGVFVAKARGLVSEWGGLAAALASQPVATWGLIAGSVIALVIIVWHLTWVASER